MGQQPSTLTPHVSPRHFLGAELRRWREVRGLSAKDLAGRVHVSPDLVQKVEKAQRQASADLVRGCDATLDTGGALGRLLDYITHLEQAPEPEPLPAPPAPSVSITVKITAEVAPDEPGDLPGSALARSGEARIYAFPGSQRRSRGRSRDGP